MKLKCTLINVTSLIILFVGVILTAVVKPHRRGFWCSDESIKYPRIKDTVGTGQLALIVLVVPLIVILVSELVAYRLNLNSNQSVNSRRQLNINGRNHVQPSTISSESSVLWSTHLNSILINWLFSLFVTAFLTGFMKTSVGRLRPVFYLSCQSNVSCDDQQNQGIYITDYVCNIKPSEETFLRTSFPSGHSSYSISSMLFLIIYIGQRFKVTPTNGFRYLIGTLQTLFLAIALYVALSRVSDNIHHWSDVLAGLILGTGVTLVCTLFLGPSNDQWSVGDVKRQMETNNDPPEQMETFCQK